MNKCQYLEGQLANPEQISSIALLGFVNLLCYYVLWIVLKADTCTIKLKQNDRVFSLNSHTL